MPCSFQGPQRAWSRNFSVVIARGPHLFPFRTEQLSPSAPMVLGSQGPGRVGRRRFNLGRPSGRPFLFGLPKLPPVETWEIIALVVVLVVILFFIGGLLGVRAHARRQAATFEKHVRAADEALEQARALDRGWDRETME